MIRWPFGQRFLFGTGGNGAVCYLPVVIVDFFAGVTGVTGRYFAAVTLG
jgi:hypothetical protein